MKFDVATDSFILEKHDLADRQFQETLVNERNVRSMQSALELIGGVFENALKRVEAEAVAEADRIWARAMRGEFL